MTQPQNVLFREIHKNAWLKRLQTIDKRNGAFPKKGERVWVVFCVHDDSEAFLEIYLDQKLAVAHKPDWFISLNNCLHVSPTICAQEDEYEFVITLSSEVIRLAAPSWEIMMEWVETIRSKLQEMRILSPRENIYSKMPEVRLPLAPTRDPNSPLPPTPMGPSARVPGIEPVHLENVTLVDSHTNSLVGETEIENAEVQTNGANYEIRSSTALYITQSEPPVYTRPRHVLNRAVSVPDSSSYGSSLRVSPGPRNSAASNVTVIEVNATNQQVSHSALPSASEDVFNFNEIETSLNSSENAEAELSVDENNSIETDFVPSPRTPPFGVNNESVSSFVLSNFSRATEPNHMTATASTSRASVSVDSDSNVTFGAGIPSGSGSRQEEALRVCGATCLNYELNSSLFNGAEAIGHYECVFLPSQNSPAQDSTVPPLHTSSQARPVETSSACMFSRCLPLSINAEGQSQIAQAEQVLAAVCSNGAPTRQRSRSTSLSEGSTSRPCVSAARNPNGGAARTELERRLQPPPHPYRYIGTAHNADTASPGRLTLREQQVLQLRREMIHPGGVRLQLRRKDCTNSIALVDAFGAVWIAGWKQKEHPMLYNALHIGDHLVSTCGVLVQNANDAQKLIRGTSSLYVEFVLRRVPCGRVFAIRRDCEGQSLGIVQEGNTAEVKDVVPGSPAARHGLAPRAPTCDGLSLTNWVLTEINGRPLNLFFKDGEVRDRLNAVGRDISILVQPADLVKQLKKQLKCIRSYKDYIVQ